MSTSLFWAPKPKQPDPQYLPDELKGYILRRNIMGDDIAPLRYRIELSSDDLSFMGWLEGLRDCGVDGAQVLWEALQMHTIVEIWLDS